MGEKEWSKRELELYIHIPFCVKKCGYCDFLSFPADEPTQLEYVQALLGEIQYYGKKSQNRRVSTIYIGGGTPSWLKVSQMVLILERIRACFLIEGNAEISMECNPGTVTETAMKEYAKAGINRLSIGLQSADDGELKMLGRIHTYHQFLKTYEFAQNADITNINVDVMGALPGQTVENYLRTLQKVTRLKPQHISAYSLIVEEGTPFYEQYAADVEKQKKGEATAFLPSEEEVYRMDKATQYYLKQAGYERYEISNYAKPNMACRHNIGYWKRVEYLGLGLGAASLLGETRSRNTCDLRQYLNMMGRNTKGQNIQGRNLKNQNMQDQNMQDQNMQDQNMQDQNMQNRNMQDRNTQNRNMQDRNMQDRNIQNRNIQEDWESIRENQVLSRKEQMEEFLFLGLRLIRGIQRSRFQNCFGVPLEAVYAKEIKELIGEGLAEQKEGWFYLTERGLDVSNYALAKFLQ